MIAGNASVAKRVLCHSARGHRWTSLQPSRVWQDRSTAFEAQHTHAYTPWHAAMQRLALHTLHSLTPLVSSETRDALRQFIDALHAQQLEDECNMRGTLNFAELNEIMCRNDAHVSALSRLCCHPCMRSTRRWLLSFVHTRLLPLLTLLVSSFVQNMTVREALETGAFFRSCSENALGDRMVCELLQDELKALKSESFVVIVL